MIKLTKALEDYLECIYILNLNGGKARTTDISKQLNISKPSVNRAVGVLVESGYVEHEKYGKISLTSKGQTTAETIYYRHQSIYKFLTKQLGVNPETAEEDACKIEHIISHETLEKLVEYTNKQ